MAFLSNFRLKNASYTISRHYYKVCAYFLSSEAVNPVSKLQRHDWGRLLQKHLYASQSQIKGKLSQKIWTRRCFSTKAIVDIELNDYIMKFYERRKEEFNEVQNILSDNVEIEKLSQIDLSRYNKLYQDLKPFVDRFQRIQENQKEILELDMLMSDLSNEDAEMKKLAAADKSKALEDINRLNAEILDILTPDETIDDHDVILEISCGVGGQEAMLFAKEMCDMYLGFIALKKWSSQVLVYDTTEGGGLRKASISVSGASVYKFLKYESGVHRVQRNPATEKYGRIHTSTITVSILPKPEEIEVNILPSDLEVQCTRSSGAGGQHVNKTDSAVRMTHLPTGTVVECQVHRSQIQNRKLALEILRARIYQSQLDTQIEKQNQTRKLQVGSASRSEKIRTYNFPQDRITDHRIAKNVHSIALFMSGQLHFSNFIDMLHHESKMERINKIIENK